MRLIELNIFQKILNRLILIRINKKFKNDFEHIEHLFEKNKVKNNKIFKKNLKIFFKLNNFQINRNFIFKSEHSNLFIENLYSFLKLKEEGELNNLQLYNLTNKNLLRLYRLLIFFKKYHCSKIIRDQYKSSYYFKLEDEQIKHFQNKLDKIKFKKKQSIAVIGPLNDLDKFKEDLEKYDKLLLINPSDKFLFENFPKNSFCFYFRNPSIKAIDNSNFIPPKINYDFVVSERLTKSNYIYDSIFKTNNFNLEYRTLFLDKNLNGKFNAIQSIILHLIQQGYKDIGIFSCDLFCTPREKNKRIDYAPNQLKEYNLIIEKKIQIANSHICHDPYLNFMVLKILFSKKIINPYPLLRNILEMPYEEYLKNIDAY